jgi:hypothetical protein
MPTSIPSMAVWGRSRLRVPLRSLQVSSWSICAVFALCSFTCLAMLSEAQATVNVYFSTSTPSLQAEFIANATNQYDATLTPSPYFPGTYTITIKGKNPNYNPPSPSTPTVNAAQLLNALVQVSSTSYPYGWVDGQRYERYNDLQMLQSYVVQCSSPTSFSLVQATTTTWNAATCGDALWNLYYVIYQQNFAVPPVIPGY